MNPSLLILISDLDQLGQTPDIIHGLHHLETAEFAKRRPYLRLPAVLIAPAESRRHVRHIQAKSDARGPILVRTVAALQKIYRIAYAVIRDEMEANAVTQVSAQQQIIFVCATTRNRRSNVRAEREEAPE